MARLQAVRGMHDILMSSTPRWRFLEETIRSILYQYGYQEIRLPVIEKTELFSRSIGEGTDIVSKEMYTFEDRNHDSLTLRPEGTAGCVRAGVEHGLFHNQTQRLWYMGPMFRRERPQKGRLRQFHQIGVEVFGLHGPDIDAELILMCARIWKALNLSSVTLEINSLGTATARANYRKKLLDYFSAFDKRLDEENRSRLQRNPLRILDSKDTNIQELVGNAPTMDTCLDAESAEHFARLRQLLDSAGLPYRINPRLVRGLDYYGKTVFEWVSEQLGAQGTVCGGGRYDGLAKCHGASPTPAVGFAMGLERLLELSDFDTMEDRHTPHIYLLLAGEKVTAPGLRLAEQLRDALPELRIMMHCGGGSFKSQFKRADKSGAELALVLGEDELACNAITIKYLREDTPQHTIPWSETPDFLVNKFSVLESTKPDPAL